MNVRTASRAIILAAWLPCLPVDTAEAQSRLALVGEATPAHVRILPFRAIGGVEWSGDDAVAVIDRDEQHVVVMDLGTGATRTVGRAGEGPGEMRNAVMLLAGPASGFVVGDMQLRRVSLFEGSGGFVGSHRLPGLPIQLVGLRDGVLEVAWMELGRTPRPMVGEIDLASGALTESYALYDAGLTPPESDNPFAPPLFAFARMARGVTLVGEGSEYRIVAVDGGRPTGSFGRPELPAQLPTPEEIAAARERMARRSAGRPPPPELAQRMEASLEAPRPFFGPGAFAADSADRLWVVTSRVVGDSTEVDVFSSSGKLLQTLRLPDTVLSLAFHGSRIAVLVERRQPDVEGLQGVDLYRLTERGRAPE